MTIQSLVRTELLQALTPVRLSLQADHADLELVDLVSEQLQLKLVIGPDTCLDCMMPAAVIEEVILMNLEGFQPAIASVRLEDPREDRGPGEGQLRP